MTPVARLASVILMSFAVIVASAASTYLVWSNLSDLEAVWRDVIALLFWVTTFFAGTFLMWRGVLRLSGAT